MCQVEGPRATAWSDHEGPVYRAGEEAAGARALKASRVEPAQGLPDSLADSAVASAAAAEPGKTRVCWMASGTEVCSVDATPDFRLHDLKACIRQHTGIHADEQRLLGEDGRELSPDAAVFAFPVLRLVRSEIDPRVTDLGHFRPSRAGFEPLVVGNFSVVKKLAKGINGDVFRYRWRQDGAGAQDVTVKKLRNAHFERQRDTERNERRVHLTPGYGEPEAEDALTEIGVLSYLRRQPDLPDSLLRLSGVFAAPAHTWLVTEFCDDGDLFEVAAAGALKETQVKAHMKRLLEAVAFLHRHYIGHRDISLENVLLRGGEVKLMDFGMSVRSHSSGGMPLRFFRAVGKNYYRPPECYVPKEPKVAVPEVPAGASLREAVAVRTATGHLCEVMLPADAAPGKPCTAEVWGYAARPADVFASGVCLFILLTGSPPWHQALLSDAIFYYLHAQGDAGLERLFVQWQKRLPSADGMQLLRGMIRTTSSERPTAEECLSSPWFHEVTDAAPAAM